MILRKKEGIGMDSCPRNSSCVRLMKGWWSEYYRLCIEWMGGGCGN
jgi:hypothetical protein